MFCIKNEQLRVFETVRFPLFEQKMITHISNNFEKQATVAGRQNLCKLIQHGYKNATTYNLVTGYEVCLYIDLMIMLGHGFDTDPHLLWANDILTNQNQFSATEKIELVYKRATGFIEMITGNDEHLPIEQYQKLTGLSFADLQETISVSPNIATVLNNFWPAKFKLTDTKALHYFIETGNGLAKNAGFTSQVNIAYYIMLMFLFGYRFDIDLQYHWLKGVISNNEVADETYKAECLHFMVQNFLQALLVPGHLN